MSLESKITELSAHCFTLLNETELDELLTRFEVVDQRDTLICGVIRILKQDHFLYIQETSNRNEIILRPINSLNQANQFVQERMKIYERMWDGCGCKIDYYK
jgi:hypothetical protein